MRDPEGQASGARGIGSGANPPRSLIVGCGSVGEAVATRLRAAGHDVSGLRRSDPKTLPVGLPYTPLQADLTEPDSLATLIALDAPFDWVVLCASASGGDAEAYRRVYFEGTRNLLGRLQRHPPKAFVYTGSTSVYCQKDGSWVTEESDTEPSSESIGWLLGAEQLILQACRDWGLAGRILRVAGIYGLGRGSLLQRVLLGQAHLEGSGDRWTNRIHREDLADAIVSTLARGRVGEVYNVADLEPATQRTVLEWLSAQTGKALVGSSGTTLSGTRRRGASNKRVSVDKIRRETGWKPIRSSFREGYLEELRRLQDDGTLAAPEAAAPSPTVSRAGS